MGVAYDDCGSPLVQPSERGMWKAGFRCPDVIISPVNGGEALRLYSEVSYGKYIVLALGGMAAIDVGFSGTVFQLSIVGTASSFDNIKRDRVYKAAWVDKEEAFFVVVRPDMYISCVAENLDSCRRHLGMLFQE